MSMRTPIIFTAGCLLLLWIYFTIHQFWTAIRFVTDPPVMMAYNNAQPVHVSHSNTSSRGPPDDKPDQHKAPSSAPTPISKQPDEDDEELYDEDESDDTLIGAPTLQPSPILIEDPYLSEEDEVELTFEFDNDGSLYLYDVPYFHDQSIFIMSMVTNSSELALAAQLHTLDELSCIFRNTFVLIFESNSLDSTPQVLRNWTLNENSNLQNHESFCKQYLFGFHRQRLHPFGQTGDYLNDLFFDNTSKLEHIEHIAQTRKTTLLNKTILFGDEYVSEIMNKFQRELQTRFLDRIEKYSFYRNMLLEQMTLISKRLDFHFDYLMILDLDIYGFQQRLLLSELYYYHKKKRANDNNGNVVLCSHGTLAHGFYVDTFASVDIHNQWYYEYQRNTTYENVTDLYLKGFPRHRFEAMRSCFGGIVIYSNVDNIIESGCNYDVTWSQYDVPNSVQQPVVDAQYKEVTYFANLMREWRAKKKSKQRRYKKKDNHICEHIPFHFCLYYRKNYSIAIAKYAYLFYEPAKMYKLDFNERLIEQTPAPTSETAKQRRRRQRRAEIAARKKQQQPQQNAQQASNRRVVSINADDASDVKQLDRTILREKRKVKGSNDWLLLLACFLVIFGLVLGLFSVCKVLGKLHSP